MANSFLHGQHPRVIGHRGAAGLAPENTLPSFALALSLGAEILELDVHGTRDGAIVVFHDDTLERTTNGEGPIKDQPLAALQRLDAGCRFTRDGHDFPYRGHGVRVPTFEELLRLYPDVRCNVEVKQADPAIAPEVVALLRRLRATDRVLLAAEHGEIMDDIRRHGPEITTSFSAPEVVDFMGRVQNGNWDNYHPAGCALQIPPRFGDIVLAAPEVLSPAHRLGLEMHVWTINQADEMAELFRLGVDGVISDVPGLAKVCRDAHLAAPVST